MAKTNPTHIRISIVNANDHHLLITSGFVLFLQNEVILGIRGESIYSSIKIDVH